MTFDDEKDLLEAGYWPVFSNDAGTIVGWFVPDGTRYFDSYELEVIMAAQAIKIKLLQGKVA